MAKKKATNLVSIVDDSTQIILNFLIKRFADSRKREWVSKSATENSILFL